MHKIAEEGIAAHWQYKKVSGDEKFDKKLSWLKQVFSFGDKDGKRFINALKLDLFSDKIFVFTPKGDVIELVKGSTILDFAYAVHSNLGDKCTGGKVNDKFVNMKYELDNGDLVEIITSKLQKPSSDWLKFVKTPKARVKIREAIRARKEIPTRMIPILNKEVEKSGNLILAEIKNADVKIARCCDPLPGEEIIGFVSRTNKVLVHKINCDKVKLITKKRLNVEWNTNLDFPVKINVVAVDKVGLLAEIMNIIASRGVNIKKANLNTVERNVAELSVVLEKASLEEIRNLIEIIRKIADVKKVSIS